MTTVCPSSEGCFSNDTTPYYTYYRYTYFEVVSWTWQRAHCSQMAFKVITKYHSIASLVCGGKGYSHHVCAATAWCHHAKWTESYIMLFYSPKVLKALYTTLTQSHKHLLNGYVHTNSHFNGCIWGQLEVSMSPKDTWHTDWRSQGLNQKPSDY